MPKEKNSLNDRRGLGRDIIERHYSLLLERGLIADAEAVGKSIQLELSKEGFTLTPKGGWTKIGYEIVITELSLSSSVDGNTAANSELSKECSKIAASLRKAGNRAANLSRHEAVSIAQIAAGVKSVVNLAALLKMAADLERIADHLRRDEQKSKWRVSEMRSTRLALAVKLSPIFEAEFGTAARPVGGSASVPLSETNEWTIFFHVVASFILGGHVTADRQAILWEATRQSEI